MAKIALVAVNARYMHTSFSCRCLKANLGDLEDQCALLEFVIKSPLEEVLSAIAHEAPLVLGISGYIWNHCYLAELLSALPGYLAGKGIAQPLVVLGGPELQDTQASAGLENLAQVVIRGEGETVFRRLCREYLSDPEAWAQQNQLSGRSRPVVLHGQPEDTHALALPYHLYTPEDLRHHRFIYAESSRGCPYSCAFCLSSRDQGVRFFPEEAFLEAMADLIRRGGRRFKILDRTFNAHVPRAVRILEFFLQHLPEDAFVHVELVPHRLPQELREVLARFPQGKLRVEIGIQTFNPLAAGLVNRHQELDQELENLTWLRDKTSAMVHADLIAGLPGEDLASFARGFNQLWELRPGEIQLGLLKRLPGTALGNLDSAWGMEYDPQAPYQVRRTSVLGYDQVDFLVRFARLWELVVNRGNFEDQIPALLPPGRDCFERFSAFTQDTWDHFGRGHGLDRSELRDWIVAWCAGRP